MMRGGVHVELFYLYDNGVKQPVGADDKFGLFCCSKLDH